MDRITLMKTFLKVADTGSFTIAAERLGTTPQLTSKYVRALENELSAQLFHRSTRQVHMTETGNAFYERCARLIDDFDELKADVRQDHCSLKGELRLTAPHCFGGKYLVDILADFSTRYPEISATIDLTDRYINLTDEGVDVAIRVGSLEDSTLLAKQIGMVSVILCASPDYLSKAPPLNNPNDLKNHACIVDTNFKSRNKWTFMVDGQPEIFNIDSRLKINSAAGARLLALKNQGIILTLDYMVAEDIETGRLTPLLTDYMASKLAVHAVYPPTRHLSAKVRRFIDFMSDELKQIK